MGAPTARAGARCSLTAVSYANRIGFVHGRGAVPSSRSPAGALRDGLCAPVVLGPSTSAYAGVVRAKLSSALRRGGGRAGQFDGCERLPPNCAVMSSRLRRAARGLGV